MGDQVRAAVLSKSERKKKKKKDKKEKPIRIKRTTLTPGLQERLCSHLEAFIPIKDACALERMTDRCHYTWLTRGKDHVDLVDAGKEDETEDKDIPYAEYYLAVKAALANFRKRIIDRSFVTDAFMPGWIRDITILERRDRDDWGRHNDLSLDKEDFNPDESFL